MKCFILLFICFSSACFSWNEAEARLISSFLPKNPVIVEAGAHVGNETVFMSRAWPGGVVHAFEPREDLYLRLVANVTHYTNVKTYQLALGDQIGFANFFESTPKVTYEPANEQSSLFRPLTETWPESWNQVIGFSKQSIVPVTTLADWAQQHGIVKIDLLWLDTQGNECQILQASPEILQNVSVLKTEFSREPVYEGTVPYDVYKNWLEEQGFVCIDEYKGNHGDAIFVKKNLLQ